MTGQIRLNFPVTARFEGCCLRDFLRTSGVSATLIKAANKDNPKNRAVNPKITNKYKTYFPAFFLGL